MHFELTFSLCLPLLSHSRYEETRKVFERNSLSASFSSAIFACALLDAAQSVTHQTAHTLDNTQQQKHNNNKINK